jgi:hypothetical protein
MRVFRFVHQCRDKKNSCYYDALKSLQKRKQARDIVGHLVLSYNSLGLAITPAINSLAERDSALDRIAYISIIQFSWI